MKTNVNYSIKNVNYLFVHYLKLFEYYLFMLLAFCCFFLKILGTKINNMPNNLQ